jgi:hypothetical protein
MKLTQAAIAGLTLPAGSDEKTYWDDDIPLFGVSYARAGRRGGFSGIGSAAERARYER